MKMSLKRLVNILTLTIILSNISGKLGVTDINYTVYDLSNPINRFSDIESKLFYDKHDQESFSLVQKKSSSVPLNFLNLEDFHKDVCDGHIDSSKPNFYYFLPSTLAVLKKEGDSFQYSNKCFTHNVATLEKLSKKELIIKIVSSDAKNLFCKDDYWFSSSNIHRVESIFFKGEHHIKFSNLSQDDLDEISTTGFRLFGFCNGFFTFLNSFFMSLKLYIGGLGKDPSAILPILRPSVPENMEKENVEFLSQFANFRPESRGEISKNILEIDEKEIKTGDFVAIYRLDGLDPLIMYGTGSHLGHSAVACWIDGELYVIESQDGWYWPKRGIQRNKWKTWIQWAHNADFSVAILPLREEIRQKLDVDKAIQWFTSGIEGLPYGFHNFIYGWIDTPTGNFPDFFTSELILSVFSVLENISKSTSDQIMSEALNLRLNTQGLTLPQLIAESARRGKSFGELLAMPEVDGLEYHDGKSYVCSSFVVAFWKAGGLFGDLNINATEFTPRDAYQLNFFDLDYKDKRPQACKDADPDLPYCQIMGRYQITLNGYSTIDPYDNMFERCSSTPPNYLRPANC
jgi:hypothetical protein